MKQMLKVVVAPAALVFLAALVAAKQNGEEPLTVSAIRFFQPASGTTTIEGVCEVRLPALLRGASQVSQYRVEVAVLDSAGLELQHSDWTRDVPASLAHARGSTIVESFGFDAAPGRYRVRVRLVPSAGETVERTVDVAAYANSPAMSDLLLANGVRQPGSDTETPAPGEIRRAGLLMRSAPVPRLTPAQATLSWYAEVYPRSAATGEMRAEVLGPGGRSVIATPPRPVTFPETGGLTRGSLDLAGLPEGSYTLRLRLHLGDTTLVAESPFAMSSVAALVAEQPATGAIRAEAPEDLFSEADEARLDSLAAPLVFVVESQREMALYRTLTTEGKRRFLREFWARRDPTPGTPENEARNDFYHGVAYANEAFKESGRADLPGWNTDRGRVYLKNGRWDELLTRPAASPRPYEVWKYTRGRPRYYVFQDQTGIGHYTLLGTNDRTEVGRAQWERLLGLDGAKDAYQFLGLDIRSIDTNP
jgi:GWxTD domain-containing protein